MGEPGSELQSAHDKIMSLERELIRRDIKNEVIQLIESKTTQLNETYRDATVKSESLLAKQKRLFFMVIVSLMMAMSALGGLAWVAGQAQLNREGYDLARAKAARLEDMSYSLKEDLDYAQRELRENRAFMKAIESTVNEHSEVISRSRIEVWSRAFEEWEYRIRELHDRSAEMERALYKRIAMLEQSLGKLGQERGPAP